MSLGKYSVVGVVATAVHYAVLVVAVEAWAAPAAEAAAGGAAVGAVTAYWGNRRYTFTSAKTHRRAVPAFLAVAMMSAALSACVVWLLSQRLGLYYLVAQVLATVTTLVVGYSVNKRWTFAV
ncbi:GtrA family protein [Alicycliphilus sp. B1]|nr:GtrA family protein [Alicycliphilus sp. B1]